MQKKEETEYIFTLKKSKMGWSQKFNLKSLLNNLVILIVKMFLFL